MQYLVSSLPRHEVGGVTVLLWLSDDDEAKAKAAGALCLERLAAAHELLVRYPPRPHGAWGSLLRRIVVRDGMASRASWYVDTDLCAINRDFLAHPYVPAAAIAGVIVHEAQHARIHRLGIRYTPATMQRIERLCFTAQLDFLLQIPGADAAVRDARELLAMMPSAYTPAANRQKRLAELEQSGAPAWARRLVGFLIGLRS